MPRLPWPCTYPSLDRLVTPLGDTSPMGLTWTFMGFSKPYEAWAGLGRLWRMFVANRPVPPAKIGLTRFRWLNWVFVAFGFTWMGVHLYMSHTGNMQMLEQHKREFQELYGVWEVQEHMLNGEELAADDPRRWKLLAIDQRESGWVRTVGDSRLYLHLVLKAFELELGFHMVQELPYNR